jgi:hypothetical protein
MCDKCGNIFSELAEGWQSYTVSTRKKDANGYFRNEAVAMDACPPCSFQETPEPTIRQLAATRVVDTPTKAT